MSLAVLLVGVTLLCVVFGWISDRAHRQRHLIEVVGGRAEARRLIIYEHEIEFCKLSNTDPELLPEMPRPLHRWLMDLLGDDYFVSVAMVDFSYMEPPIDDNIIDAVSRIRTLQSIRFGYERLTQSQIDKLRAAHPHCEIRDAEIFPLQQENP